MNKRYLIAVVVISILLLGISGFSYMKAKQNKQSSVTTNDALASNAHSVPLVNANPASQENWKTYKSEKGYFSLQYPSQWIEQEEPNEDTPSKSVTLSGEEGSVTVNWGAGFGGACASSLEKITIGTDELDVCHTPKNTADSETWTLISKDLSKADGTDLHINISAGANAPAQDSRVIVLKVLQGLQFQAK